MLQIEASPLSGFFLFLKSINVFIFENKSFHIENYIF